MAPETTDLEQAAPVIEQAAQAITGATCVLFDFDGPICGLFAEHRAHDIAERLIAWLEREDFVVPLTGAERDDPHAVLRVVGASRSPLVHRLEKALTDEELRASVTAEPTPHVDRLIRAWSSRGVPLAIATNNSPLAAESYLTRRDLTSCFDRHIYGRTRNLDHLKPDPDCLNRALHALDADPAKSLMIGDTPSDLEAARRAGVAFLGYAEVGRRTDRLRRAGAETVIHSLEDVLVHVESDGRQA
ncbi:hydrolase [Streptomyces spiroverticillatus]|uniref:Hydrolase n=1 Tax=Streptomyces finlayi TaxID=67296 RepID=A0A918WTM4_9ACTN|nr:HAD family hydrolase [Streptomyces finlayi]GGZ97119.1 hydrolase [Streptomyces spiroverticillatus]GHC82331.1 hydrolase [Streptomyces finlayi]